MTTAILYVTLFLLLITSTWGINFSPNVTIRSCHSRKLVIDVQNAVDGGIVYIQGRSADCRRYTTSQTSTHQFDFETCSIDYDSKFRLVIQRNPVYQTGTDKVIPVMCLVDTSDIYVSSVIFPEEILDGSSVNRTIKPIIDMNILAENESSLLDEVTLNDKVKLNLQLDDQYTGIFDIKATDCSAALIPILENECSIDDEMFPNFVKMSQGKIVSTFNAFTPTNLPGETEIEVGFTCTVSVCKGVCEETICGEILGWGRRKRNSVSNEKIVEDVTVTTKLKVKPKVNAKTGIVASQKSEYCAEKKMVTAVTGLLIVVLIFSWMICGCTLCKLRRLSKKTSSGPKMPNAMRRLSEINTNFAKSVGRRLSTIFMPTGYDVRDQRIVDGVPVFDTPPSKRRDSVTVRNEDMFNLRKRFVSSATQTSERLNEDMKSEGLVKSDTESVRLLGDSSMRSLSSPITSISISSAATKCDKTSMKRNPSIPRQNSESIPSNSKVNANTIRFGRAATIGGLTGFSQEESMSDSIEPVINYDLGDVPKARKPYVGIIQVRNTSDCTPKRTTKFGNAQTHDKAYIPKSELVCDDETNESIESGNDDIALEAIPKLTETQNSRANRVVLTSGINKSSNETSHFNNSVYDACDDTYSTVAVAQEAWPSVESRQNNGTPEQSDVSDKLDLIDDVYEVIEIGAQMKRERKYSTHV